jgi:hypothetical protein
MAEDIERWKELCDRVEKETDFDKRLALMQQVDAFLKDKQFQSKPSEFECIKLTQ